MDEKIKKKKITGRRKTAAIAMAGLSACGIAAFAVHKLTLYKPEALLLYICLLPALANLVLLLPRTKKRDVPDSGKGKAGVRFLNMYARLRGFAVPALIAAAVIVLNVLFWIHVRKPEPAVAKSFAIPVAAVVSFVILTVLEKVCKHCNDDAGEPGEDEIYDDAIVDGLRGSLVIGCVANAVVVAASAAELLSAFKITSYAVIALSVLFGYETVFLIFSLISRMVRKELATAPELTVPVIGAGGKDLGIVSYLENNTGLTMRSLWSIKLIKRILPFAALSVVLILWLFSGVVNIRSDELGALYRLGSLNDKALTPGLHMTLPWPFDATEVYKTESVNKMTIGYVSDTQGDNIWTSGHGGEEYKLLLGGGKELVSINLRVEYKINNLIDYVRSSAEPEKILEAAAYEAITDRTISTDIETLLSRDRTALAADLKGDLAKRAGKYKTGLEVVSVVLESIHPPVEIAEIYQKLIGAEIDAEKIRLDGEASAAVTVTNAHENYNFIVESEKRVYHEKIAAARSAVADYMACAEADGKYGDTYRQYKYMKAVSEAYGKATLLIVGDGVDQKHIYIGSLVDGGN